MIKPSVADLKGGLMVMLRALKVLDERGLLEDMAVSD